MKKWILVALFGLMTPALAADSAGMRTGKYGMAGCGMGSMVWESNSMGQQILAGTTNGTFGTQTFGISSGTSNCTSHGTVMREKEQEVFVSMNFESLTQDIAKGNGETLAAFTTLLGCSGTANEGQRFQSSYQAGSLDTSTPEALLNTAKVVCQPQG